jgi:hypothetical protein
MDKKMYESSVEELLAVDLPEQTRTYKVISHKNLIETTREAIDKMGFSIDREEYTQAKDGKQANGRYIISGDDKEMQLMLGWQNSYDKKLSLKFAIGAQIFICTNGSVRGDIGNFKKKHQGDVQEFAPLTISEDIKAASDIFYQLQGDRDRMKNTLLNKRDTAELIGRMYIEDMIITSTQLNVIKEQIIHPSFDYQASNTLWELYNHTTYALKESHPSNWLQQHIDVHDFMIKNLN